MDGGTAEAATTLSPTLAPPRAFDEASRMVVDYLARTMPMGVWAVTRVSGAHQTVLVSADGAYGFVGPGAEFPWSTSMCRTMAAGETPRVAPDVRAVPGLAAASTAADAQSVPVGAYVGTPIVHPDGRLFGTVCGYDPAPQPRELAEQEPLLDLLSSLLSSVLEADVAATESARALEEAVAESETDALTGLLNRRGWDRWLAREEQRFRRFGDPASVVMLDLDQLKLVNDTQGHDAGDEHLQVAAETLRNALRHADALARLGGDEFGMVVRAGPEDARRLVERLESDLEAAGVLGSFGYAPYRVVTGFPEACAAADTAMYENKRLRRVAREHP